MTPPWLEEASRALFAKQIVAPVIKKRCSPGGTAPVSRILGRDPLHGSDGDLHHRGDGWVGKTVVYDPHIAILIFSAIETGRLVESNAG